MKLLIRCDNCGKVCNSEEWIEDCEKDYCLECDKIRTDRLKQIELDEIKNRKLKNCPKCVNWWFTRYEYGCTKGEISYTTYTLPKHSKETCKFFEPLIIGETNAENRTT